MYCSNHLLRIVPTVGSTVLFTALTTFLELCQNYDQHIYIYIYIYIYVCVCVCVCFLLNKPIAIYAIYSCILYTSGAKVLSQQISMFHSKQNKLQSVFNGNARLCPESAKFEEILLCFF